MPEKINIGVFYSKDKKPWELLPGASKFLTDNQLTPNRGDRITACENDYQVMKIDKSSFDNCITVNEKVFHYSPYDVALVCDYKPF